KFKVRAVCGSNTGSWSPIFNFTVGAGGGGGGSCTNLGTPTGLNVTNIAFPSATLGWNSVAGATSYSVNVQNGSGNATPLDTTFTSTGTSVVFGSFPVTGNYKFKVRALCGANTGSWSPVFNFTVGSGGGGGGGNCNNLPAPTGLNVTNIAFPSATLGWNAVAGATSYVVNVQNASGNPTPFNQTLVTTNTSVVVNSFPVVGNYKFKVRAMCGANTGSWSPVFNFTVTAFAPPNSNNSMQAGSSTGAGFSIFPNPAHGSLVSLQLDNFEGQNVQVRVIGLTGKVMFSEHLGEWAGGIFELNLQQAQAGLYLVEVQAEGERHIQKLLMQ
ncbi:MAG: fibronectin type III domain-containing protein, partial [Bacteroidota bacterium]